MLRYAFALITVGVSEAEISSLSLIWELNFRFSISGVIESVLDGVLDVGVDAVDSDKEEGVVGIGTSFAENVIM